MGRPSCSCAQSNAADSAPGAPSSDRSPGERGKRGPVREAAPAASPGCQRQRQLTGQSIVEFVVVLPVLLIVLSGLVDLGRLYFAYVAITDAAAEGATYGASYPPWDAPACGTPLDCDVDLPRQIDCLCLRAQAATGGLVQVEADQIAVACPECFGDTPSGSAITVTVTYSFTVVTPFVNALVPDGVLPLRAVARETVVVGALP